MVIPDVTELLKSSQYESQTKCIKTFLERSRVFTIKDLENSVRFIGPKLCGFSSHELIIFIRDSTHNPPKAKPAPKPKPVPVKKVTKKVEAKEEPKVDPKLEGENPPKSLVTNEPVPEVQADSDEDAQKVIAKKGVKNNG